MGRDRTDERKGMSYHALSNDKAWPIWILG